MGRAPMNFRLVLTLSALRTALCLSAALLAAANPAASTLQLRASRAAASNAQSEAERRVWQSEYRALLVDYSNASERSANTQYDWRSERKRRRLRGNAKVEARDEIEASHQALVQAMSAIRVFHERARRQGALPGWLYVVETEFPDIASAVAAR